MNKYMNKIADRIELEGPIAYWFGLVSLSNGISTFVGYLMPKPFS